MSHRGLIGCLLGGCLLLVGCTSVPTSGPVVSVSAEPGRINPGVEIAPAPPGKDATPAEVVEGFLHAMASWQPGYAVARDYLTADASASWDPTSGVRVYAEGSTVTIADAGARLSAPLVGEVDSEGTYHQSHGELDQDFGLVQDDSGQWRISRPPEGLIVSEYLFSSAFEQMTIYFNASGQPWLVPDTRYFPRGDDATLTAAVTAVATGQSGWLASAVDMTSIVPDASVEMEASGTARVSLVRPQTELTDEERTALVTRLAWTLRGFTNISAFEVGWQGEEPWSVDTYGTVIPVTAFPEANPEDALASTQLYGIVSGRVARLEDGAGGLDTILSAPGIEGATFAAVDPDALRVAAVTDSGRSLVEAPTVQDHVTPIAESTGFVRPQYTREGELWTLDQSGRMSVIQRDGSATDLDLDSLSDWRVVAFRIAPDGVRVALVLEGPSGSREVGLAVIDRAEQGVSLTGLRILSASDSAVTQRSVIDVGWRTSVSLLALVSDGSTQTVVSMPQDGSVLNPIGPIQDAQVVELAVAPGVTPWVRTSDGELLRYIADLRWAEQPTTVSAVFYPG